MSTLSDTAFAKLNLALHVRRRRPDGRHDIETVFAFCDHGDIISVAPADDVTLTIVGPFAAGLSTEDNLVLRAASALRLRAGTTAGAAINLDKRLPVASGIGGGSADAAATLRLLTKLWRVDPDYAAAVAPALGSDVPACLSSQPARGIGAGDQLQPIDLVRGVPVLLVNPRTPLATADVFAGWNGIDAGPLDDWREGRNDLESPAKALVPQIGLVLSWLRTQAAASFVRMSGSGATCFALFDDEKARDTAASAVPREWWHLATSLR